MEPKPHHHWTGWHWSGWFLTIGFSLAASSYLFASTGNIIRDLQISPVRATDGGSGGSGSVNSNCSFDRADYDDNGRVDQADMHAYFENYKPAQSPLADINYDGLNGNYDDDQCMNAFYAADNYSNAPQILFPTSSSSLRGVVEFIVRSPSFTTVPELTLYFRPSSINTFFSRTYSIDAIRVPNTTDQVKIPFDSLAMENGPVEITICPSAGSTGGCSSPATFPVNNSFVFTEPTSTVSGSNVRVSARFASNDTTSSLGPVTRVYYQLFPQNNGPTPLWSAAQQSRDANGDYPVTLNTTSFANGIYRLMASYFPYWQTAYVNPNYYLPRPEATITISNTTTPTNTNSGTNTNQPTTNAPVNTNTNYAVPVNTNSGSNTNQTITNTSVNTNTVFYSNTNTTTYTNTSPTSQTLTPPVISQPENSRVYYDLSQINGRAATGQTVNLTMKLNATTSSGDPGGCGFSGGEYVLKETKVTAGSQGIFTYALGQGLKPGPYSLVVWVTQNGQSSLPAYVCFRVQPPKVTMATTNNASLSGSARLDAYVYGPIKSLEFKATTGSLSPILIGRGNPAVNSNQWTVVFDSNQFLNGSYTAFARATALDGTIVASQPITLTINNTASQPSPSVIATPPTIISEPPVELVTEDTAGTAETAVGQPPTASPDETGPPSDESTPAKADPRTVTPTNEPEKLAVKEISSITQPHTETPAIVLSGVGPPNSVVTIFIYSDPIVITTKTDADGNWTYTLDQPLADGRHEVYVTVTDQTGKIASASNPLDFFVAEAQAVTEEEFLNYAAPAKRPSDTYLVYYLGIAGLLVVITIVIFLAVKIGHRPPSPAMP